MPDRMELRDEDRLPWLETVEPDEEPRGGARAVVLAFLGLLAVLAAAWGLYRWQAGARSDGDGQLIAAQDGDYKVRPDDPGGLKVEGEGDAAVATSQGKGSNQGAVDLRAVPEAPVARTAAAPTPGPAPAAPAGRSASAEVPRSGGRLVASPPMTGGRRNVPGAAGGGSLVQLGAFPSEAAANAAWGGLAKRFGYLAALGKSVQAVELNGRTFYRLRVNAGSAGQAADIVAKLRVAGEESFVTS